MISSLVVSKPLPSSVTFKTEDMAQESELLQSPVAQQPPSPVELLLAPFFAESKARLGNAQSLMVTGLIRFAEDKTFLKFNDPSSFQYLKFVLDYNSSVKDCFKAEARDLVAEMESEVQSRIEEEQCAIVSPQRKKQKEANLLDSLSRKNEQVKSRVHELSESINSVISSPSHALFQHDPAKEKEIKRFLKDLRKRKKEFRKELQERSIRLNQKKLQAEEEERQLHEQEQALHKKQLLEAHQQNEQKRAALQKERKQQEEQFKKHLTQFRQRRPYHLRKEDELRKQSQSLEVEKRHFLQERHNRYKPIDVDQLKQHELKYLDIKRSMEERRADSKQLEASLSLQRKEYFKGKAHEFTQQEREPAVSAKEMASLKVQKHKDFQKLIKEKHMPRISEAKRRELVELQLAEANKTERRVPKDSREIGHSYLEQLRKLRKKAKSQAGDRKHLDLPPLPRPVNYIAELRQKRNSSVKVKEQPQDRQQQLERELEGLSAKQRRERLTQQMQLSSQRNRRNEQLLRVVPEQKSHSIKQELTSGLLTQIHTKLALMMQN